MNKKILASLAVIAIAALAAVGGTVAYFSDTQTSTANTITAGSLSLLLSNDNSNWTHGVTATWSSPANWKPGDSMTATLHFTNSGTIDSNHIYFNFHNLSHTGAANLMNAIVITDLRERFLNSSTNTSVTTANQAAKIDSQVGNHDGVLTLAELTGWMTGSYGYYTFDDQSGDGVILKGGNQKDYDLIMGMQFDPAAGNEYQGASCSFDMDSNASQNSPTEGLIRM